MNKEITLLFPGQGSQYVGMGKTLANKELFQEADQILGYPISQMCYEGPEEDLKLTQNTQPAILSHSVSLFLHIKPILQKNGITIKQVLGHSVGEYAALVAAGSLKFADAVKAVNLRGQYMQQAVPAGLGKMYAVLRVPEDLVKQACEEASTDSQKVEPANFNDPTQVVISGEANAADRAIEWLSNNFSGRMRSVELPVSAPFHCSLMQPAADQLKSHLNSLTFNPNTIAYIANIDAQIKPPGTKGSEIADNLYKQVCGSVLWTQSIKKLNDGDVCLEVGPGKVLTGLVRKINPNIKVIPLDNAETLENLGKTLEDL